MKRIINSCAEKNEVIRYALDHDGPAAAALHAHSKTEKNYRNSYGLPPGRPYDVKRPCGKNFTLREMLADNMTAAQLNRSLDTIMPPSDFSDACVKYAEERFGPGCVEDIRAVLDTGLIATADHLGGFYSPQSFQGDIMYAMTMKDRGKRLKYLPFFSFGMVSVQNSAYPKGMMIFQGQKEPARLSMIPRKYNNSMVCSLDACTPAMVEAMRKRICAADIPEELKSLSLQVTDRIYGSEKFLSQERYGEQLVRIGYELTKDISPDLPGFIFIENEELFADIIINEINDSRSLLYHILNCPQLTEEYMTHRSGNSWKTFGQVLFMGIDEKGRNFTLSLGEDGSFSGRDWEGQEVLIGREKLADRLKKKKIIPTVYLMAVVSALERGFTWCGGTFQAVYLPRLQHRTVKMLRNAAGKGAACGDYLMHMADLMEKLNCERYTSGPVFALTEGDESSLCNASLMEFLQRKPGEKELEKMMSVSLEDAHIMGMYEYYSDMVPNAEKIPDWYEILTGFYYEKYSSFLL